MSAKFNVERRKMAAEFVVANCMQHSKKSLIFNLRRIYNYSYAGAFNLIDSVLRVENPKRYEEYKMLENSRTREKGAIRVPSGKTLREFLIERDEKEWKAWEDRQKKMLQNRPKIRISL